MPSRQPVPSKPTLPEPLPPPRQPHKSPCGKPCVTELVALTVRGHWCGALTVWLTEVERSQFGRTEGSDRLDAGTPALERVRPWAKLFEVLGEGGEEGTTVLRFREPVRLRGGRGAELYVRLHKPAHQESDEYFENDYSFGMRGGLPLATTSTLSPPLPHTGWRSGDPGFGFEYRSPSVRQNIEREMRRGEMNMMGGDTYNL